MTGLARQVDQYDPLFDWAFDGVAHHQPDRNERGTQRSSRSISARAGSSGRRMPNRISNSAILLRGVRADRVVKARVRRRSTGFRMETGADFAAAKHGFCRWRQSGDDGEQVDREPAARRDA